MIDDAGETGMTGTAIVDATGAVWDLVQTGNQGKRVVHDGRIDYTTADVKQLLYFGKTVYYRSVADDWFRWQRTERAIWQPIDADPRASAAKPIYRAPWDQPFSDLCFWNMPIGADAKFEPVSAPATAQLVRARGVINCEDWSIPFYIGDASNPLVTVTCTDDLFPIRPQTLRIPVHATPALPATEAGDRHMTFFDKTQPRWMWAYWGCRLNNGRDVTNGITCGSGGVYDTRGDSINTPDPKQYGDYNFSIGTVRAWELRKGKIQHMVRCLGNYELLQSPQRTDRPEVDFSAVPWPNKHEDYWGDRYYRGHLPYGATMAIPRSVDLETVELTYSGRMFAVALQDFGCMIRDSTAHNVRDTLTFCFEPECAALFPKALRQIRSDLRHIIPLLRVMTNQKPETVNGGGPRMAPLPPPLDPGF